MRAVRSVESTGSRSASRTQPSMRTRTHPRSRAIGRTVPAPSTVPMTGPSGAVRTCARLAARSGMVPGLMVRPPAGSSRGAVEAGSGPRPAAAATAVAGAVAGAFAGVRAAACGRAAVRSAARFGTVADERREAGASVRRACAPASPARNTRQASV